MHPKPRSKTEKQVRRHFQKRLRQRYQLHLTDQEWHTLSAQCTDENLLVVQSRTRSWHLLEINGLQVYCLYQWKYGLTTCLTESDYQKTFPPLPEPTINTTLQNTVRKVEDYLTAAGGKISRTQLHQQVGVQRSLVDSAIHHLKKQGRLMLHGNHIEGRPMELFAA